MTNNTPTPTQALDFYEVVKKTPLEKAYITSEALDNNIYLKREDHQSVHSFKVRGAYNMMAALGPHQLAAGVIAASAGNHAQGVAVSAGLLGTSALIVMPKTTPDIKVEAVKRYGAEVVLYGQNYSEAYEHSLDIAKTTGRTFVHPFNDPLVIDGQGTIGAELLEQLPDVEYIFVPVGGGGLIAGVAQVVKQANPKVKIIGVEPKDSNAMTRSLEAGHPVVLGSVGVFADGVAVKQVGNNSFELVKKYVDDMVNVDTQQICQAIKRVFEENRTVLEPAGALAIAGVIEYVQTHDVHGKNIVAICSGANINFTSLNQIVAHLDL